MTDEALDLAGKRIWVAGHTGMVGSALVRRLQHENCTLLTVTRKACDLRCQAEVEAWIGAARPDLIFLAAAKVGGILANDQYPATFIYDNLAIETNVIHASFKAGVRKLLLLGSSCVYPRDAAQPIAEEALLTGPLEPTNQWYAIAKIAGIKLCQAYQLQHGCDFISCMPANLYGPGDNYDLEHSHVLPALLRKVHEAKMGGLGEVEVWGTGKARREFLHVDDLADACVQLMRTYFGTAPINVGTGIDISIAELAQSICQVVDYRGKVRYDTSKPDGTPRKVVDVTRMRALGWSSQISLEAGLYDTYRCYLQMGMRPTSRSLFH